MECFFLQRFVGWPYILKEKWRSCRPSESFETLYLHLRSGQCSWCSTFTLLTFLVILKHSYQLYSIKILNFQHYVAYSEAHSLH